MRVAPLAVLVLATSGCLYGSTAAAPDRPQPAYSAAPDRPVPDQPGYSAPQQPAYPPAAAAPEQPGYSDPAPPQAGPSDYAQQEDDSGPPTPAGTDVASEDVFTQQLSPYGNWTEVNGYGRVWVPAVSYGWRPYYYGRWELTEWGWTFVSADPWGWAAYHYGRWNWGLGVGWYWIPGRQWGPAWVSWRYGGGYVGWAPLGPRGVVFGFGHPGWIAVGETHFTQPIARVAVTGRATVGIVSAAQPLSSHVARGGSFGPPVERISAATGHTITAVPATRAIATAHAQSIGPRASGGIRSPVRPILGARPRPASRTLSGPGAARPAPGAVARPAPGGIARPIGSGTVHAPAAHPSGAAHPSAGHGGEQHK
jgi:hypothetical protein